MHCIYKELINKVLVKKERLKNMKFGGFIFNYFDRLSYSFYKITLKSLYHK